MQAIRKSLFILATFLPVVSGCGVDARAAADDAPAAVAVDAPAEVVIRARDNIFYEAPDTITAGLTNVRLINEGPMFHHVWLVRLEGGHSVNDLLEHFKAGGPPPAWMIDVGGPNTPGAPGEETSALIDLEPGTYALLCMIDLPDMIPHAMKGMARQITVVPAAAPRNVTLPQADVVMTLNDYSFTTDVAITPGRRTIRVENAAAQPHEVLIVKLDAGRTVQEFLEFVMNPEGTPPGRVIGGTTGIATGGMNQITLDFDQGDYGLICFVPDAGDGRPHLMHGMVQQLHVM